MNVKNTFVVMGLGILFFKILRKVVSIVWDSQRFVISFSVF